MFLHILCKNQQYSRTFLLKWNTSVLKSHSKVYHNSKKSDLLTKWSWFGFSSNNKSIKNIKILNKSGSLRFFSNLKNGTNEKETFKKLTSTEIIRKLFQFAWPKDNRAIKIRVMIAMSLLLASKLLSVSVPILFKQIVDFLNKNVNIKDESTQTKILYSVIALIIGYGAARAG